MVGLGRGKDRCPLVGLTATPFRGTSEEQTKRLVNRFGGRRLDQGVLPDDPYVELQRRGVLARVRHELMIGTEIRLTDEELAYLREFRRLPKSIEEFLGSDRDRNRALVDSIGALPTDWTVLLFATSVDNAQTLAAMLTLRGIAAAAISGETEPGARRHYIEEFRRGRIRVLTNYNVLTQGFDAPAVRAVYVARPTYSPNLYQQMIGRGLRGPMNGGKDECLIVNVEDNVRQYGEELAFRQFEYLWTAT
jgi:superfamily II DNA or RNA helicase